MSETERKDLFQLSLSQRNIWDLERTFDGTSINNISTTLRINGRVDFTVLQDTLNQVVAADPSLRTQIILRDDVPMQYSVPFLRDIFPVYDFSGTGDSGLSIWENTLTREAMPLLGTPLYRFVLFRTGEHSGGVFIKIHHIISDGWSQALICNRIARTYFELLFGSTEPPEDIPGYELHIQDEQEYLVSAHYENDRKYWEDQLSGFSEPSVIKDLKGAVISPVGRRLSFDLPQHINHAIYSFCIKNRVAPFAVFYMALAIYFKRTGGAERFTIGVPINNRTSFLFKQCTGMFVSTLPFINYISDQWSFSQFNENLTDAWYELLRHQRFPFKDISSLANSPDGRLFQIALSYQDSRVYENHDTSVLFSGRWHYGGYQAEQLCIHLSNLESPRRYAVDYDYLIQFFSQEEIAALHFSLMNLLTEALADTDIPICRLSMLSSDERERVLYTFNRTSKYVGKTDAYGIFSAIAAEYPNRAALICQGQRLTYSALADRAVKLCAALSDTSAEARGLAALLLPRDFTLFTSIVGVMRAGWAYLLISEETPVMRVLEILRRSGADVLITEGLTAAQLFEKGLSTPVIDVDRLPCGQIPPPRAASPEDLAYVVFTSGSTGAPKGVEITQQSLVNLAQAMTPIYGSGAILSLCNVGFDAFVLESTAALLNGRTIVLPSEEDIESPRRLAGLITDYAAGFLATTPSRLFSLLKDSDFCAAMRVVDRIVCGGEPFTRELLQALSVCTNARIYNQYGPSEATVAVSHKLLNGAASITVGAPLQNCRLYVLDQWQNPLPVGAYGELYIGGICVGQGYRGDPELTAERFIPSPFESGERLYRTGDVACWTEDGEISLSGRKDRQIKLRGLRVEPQEISSCIASHPLVTDAAARVLEISGQPAIAVYYTAEQEISSVELMTFAAAYLPRYMIPSCVMRVDSIPLTSNGKVDEARLPLPDMKQECGGQPAEGILGDVLSVFSKALEKPMNPDSDYFLSGGSSLSAMQTLAELEEVTGCLLRISDLYACRTPRHLAQCIQQRTGVSAPAAEPPTSLRILKTPKLDRYPLTPVQRGIYFQSLIDETGLLYNMFGAFRLEGTPHTDLLEGAFKALIADDEIFRTCFVQEHDGIFAHVTDSVSFELKTLYGESLEDVRLAFVAPFNLSKAPLLRAGLWHAPDGSVLLFLDTHHIISDGLTTPITMERLAEYYRGAKPRLPEISYNDYACYISSGGGVTRDDRDYWREHLSPMPEALVLPTDHPRNNSLSFKGASHVQELSAGLSKAVDDFCARQGISAYTLFLAGLGRLLSALTGQDDFTVGSPVTDRTRPELQKVCGPFINVLPLRLRFSSDDSVSDYLTRVGGEVLSMMDHSACSPEEIISLLSLPRNLSGNPLYSVMLSMRPFDAAELSFCGSPAHYVPLESSTTKTEFSVDVGHDGGVYSLRFEYADELFEEETIALYARGLVSIIASFVCEKTVLLGEIEPVSLPDRTALIDIPDHMCRPFLNLPVHEQARLEALLHPDDAAVIFHGETVSRLEIERRACKIANSLTSAGAVPGGRIGLAMSRTPDLFAGMLAILKTGCAYVPLLSGLPEKRLCYMAETAGISIILSDDSCRAQLPESLRAFTVLPSEDTAEEFASVNVSPSDLINVLFTSGSTGRPKGVMVRHSSAANLLSNMREELSGVTRPMVCATTLVFDIFITESLLPLAMGKTIVLADEEEMLLPHRLAQLIQQHDAGFIQFTASRLSMCLTSDAFCNAARRLQFTIVGGEQVSPTLVSKFKGCCPGRLVNFYGPTEATVYITSTELQEGETVTIGKPMHNCRVYVMDEQQRRVMPTAVGEMYLAGAGISPGYIARPDITEAAFFPDPFVPGEMMYKSGDIGRLRTDGRFDCHGRRDAQVKINGQRLEIDEIVNTILDSGLINQAVVLPISRENSQPELHAFCVRIAGDGSDDIAAYLRRYLPDYMVPAKFHLLTALPYTPGGKADLTVLKEMALSDKATLSSCHELLAEALPAAPIVTEAPLKLVADEATAAAVSALTAETILGIWSEVLGRENLSADLSFFEQGGTSLDALSVLSRYFNLHINITIADFYKNPTVNAQLNLMTPAADAAAVSTVWKPHSLPRYVPEVPLTVASPRILFVTGATGFFGAHLVRSLLARGASKIICLVRGDERRLFDTLSWYFGAGWAASAALKVKVVSGDVTLPILGMSSDSYETLAAEVDALYHCAADVRHYSADTDAFMDSNLSGTNAIVELALKANAPLHHISSLSVSGEYIIDSPKQAANFSERDFNLGQNWQENLYVKSKMLAESEVYSAMERRGLTARVYRLGRLVGRASDGVFQRNPDNNMAVMFARAIKALGALPEDFAELPIDLTPVDVAADAVAALGNAPLTTLHIMNPAPPTTREIFVRLIPDLKTLAGEDFDRLLSRAISLNPEDRLFTLLPDSLGMYRAHPTKIRPLCDETLSAMAQAGFSYMLPTPEVLAADMSPLLEDAKGKECKI